MKVLLASCGNPDFRQDPNKDLFGCERNRWVTVKTFKEASERCLKFIKDNELGGGNWSGGVIKTLADNNDVIAHVSYNGRVWEGEHYSADAKEIKL